MHRISSKAAPASTRTYSRRSGAVVVSGVLTALAVICLVSQEATSAQGSLVSVQGSLIIQVPPSEMGSILDELNPNLIPTELQGLDPATRQERMAAWIAQHDLAIRSRLLPGYEDTIVNLLLFGSRFTDGKRFRWTDIPRVSGADPLLQKRLSDLIGAVSKPSQDERLRFVRKVLGDRGIDPSTPDGRLAARAYLSGLVERTTADRRRYDQLLESAKKIEKADDNLLARGTIYRDRGLSSDTSIFPDFALDVALSYLETQKMFEGRPVHRAAIIGPGLDEADKEAGYDFYPLQTVQPFMLLDSLLRLGIAGPDSLRLTTFDINPLVTEHVATARQRSQGGAPYVIQLTRDTEERWIDKLSSYWQRAGTTVGRESTPLAPPPSAEHTAVRAVTIPSSLVQLVQPVDLNIVAQRLVLAPAERFDLMVATNILVYYDLFEQQLALANVAAMLRPGGLFLTNQFVLPSTSMRMAAWVDLAYTGAGDGDRIWCYQRQ